MAPAVTAVQASAAASKIKRPVPPGIQTNGTIPARSSPSPSISAKRPPSASRLPPNPPNGVSANGLSARPPNRSKREPSGQLANRGPKSAVALRSASLVPDSDPSPAVDPLPYVVTDEYILKKYAGKPPSLIVHMYPTHFRFDQQEGMFQYKSPMKIFLEHIRTRTVPHDMLEYFVQWGVPFYENCLIIQVHDHKSAGQPKDVPRPTSASSKTVPLSTHNYNPYLTPSSYAPYPKDSKKHDAPGDGGATAAEAGAGDDKAAVEKNKDDNDMPPPSASGEAQKNKDARNKDAKKTKIFTVVLRPTQQSLQMDLAIKSVTPAGSSSGSRTETLGPPPTPHTAVSPTAAASSMPPPAKKQKRERTELDGSSIYAAEAQILLATTAPLDLEPTRTPEELIRKLERHAHPDHSHKPPQPKTRKRTVAEMAADEALAADLERYMLTLDERLSAGAQSAANGADPDGQAGAAAWEPRFERFKVIADIKREHAEKKEQERIKQAENERRLALQKQQQQQQQQAEQQAALLAQQRTAEEQRRREQMAAREQQQQQQQQHQQQQQQRQEAQRRAMQAQVRAEQAHAVAAAAAAAQGGNGGNNNTNHGSNGNTNGANGLVHTPHGHPATSGPAQNGGMPNNAMAHHQAQGRFHQVSQPAASSPIIRQHTPQSTSSPLVGNVPMQHSTSSMGGSPPRPSSVVQTHGPMSASMVASMSRGSQQSHPSNTPRMPSATPNMPHATPITRAPQMVHTPRMSQASPPPGMMATPNQQVGQAMLMNGQGIPAQMNNPGLLAAQIAAQQQHQQQHQQRLQQQQQQQLAAAMQQGGMMPGTPNGQATHQQMIQQRFLQQQMMRNQMANQPNQALSRQYQQHMQNMQNMHNMQSLQGGQLPMHRQMAGAGAGGGGGVGAGGGAGGAGAQGQNIMAAGGMSPAHLAAIQQMQQIQQHQNQQHQQQQHQQQQGHHPHQQPHQQQQQPQRMGQQGANQALVNQIHAHSQVLYNKHLPALIERCGGPSHVSPSDLENLKRTCQTQARNYLMQLAQQRSANAQASMLQQQQQQQQQHQQQQQQQQHQQQQHQQAAMQGMMPQGM